MHTATRTRKRRLTPAEFKARNAEAYQRSQNTSAANFAAVVRGFADHGIPADQIEPKVNVFTYHAWRHLGRQVRRGEHGVKIVTFAPIDETDPDTGAVVRTTSRPRMAVVFHISQTDPAGGGRTDGA